MALAVVRVGGNVTTAFGGVTSDSWTSTSGSLIVVVGHAYNLTGVFKNGDVTDSKGNTYTLATGLLGGSSGIGTAIYYNNAGTRGASHTVTFNHIDSNEGANIAVCEITGQDSSPFDTATDATGSDSASPFDVTAAAAIVGNQIAIYGTTLDCSGGTQAWTQPTGYTDIINQPSSSQLVSAASYKINETGTPTVGASCAQTMGAGGAREAFATFKESAPAVTGTSSQTLADFAPTASGVETFTGTSAQTLAAFTSTATGVETFTGTSAQTLDAFTSTASGTETITGTSAQTLAAFTSTAAGVETVTGTSSQTLAAFTSTASGVAGAAGAVTGTSAQTLADFTSTASGVVETFTVTVTLTMTSSGNVLTMEPV